MLIVPGRPATGGLTWWVLCDDDQPPQLALEGPGQQGARTVVHALGRPTDRPLARRTFVAATTNLVADQAYTLRAAGDPGVATVSRTLPRDIPLLKRFTVALGSCYCHATRSVLGAPFYPPSQYRRDGDDPVRWRFLCGDQIYMDLSATSGDALLTDAPDPWTKYRDQWEDPGFREFLSASPNLVMADDHEFWNDYPHGNAWLLWAEHQPGGCLGKKMDRAYQIFQAALNLDPNFVVQADAAGIDQALQDAARTFELPIGPVSFFQLDTRTRRTRYDATTPRVVDAAWLNAAMQWARGLQCPGVLIVSQPLVERPAGRFADATHTMGDVNLPDYGVDFACLWDALFDAPHDVVVASGDIHWSRLYRVGRGGAERQVFEVISSPLARIPKLPMIDWFGSSDDATGKVGWANGTADWTRWFATDAPHTYATLSFTPCIGKVSVDVAWWAPGPASPPQPRQLGACAFTLQ